MFRQALDAFLDSGEFEEAVIMSTKAGFGGSGYSVELFGNGTWRVLWDNQIGNLYSSPGMMVGIPQYDEDTLADIDKYGDDADLSFALDEIKDTMREWMCQREFREFEDGR